MGFADFLGNERIVSALRAMLRRERVPSAVLFTGPRGIGKYTLARMFAQAANCERLKDDFCGQCRSCQRMTRYVDPTTLITEGLTERGESADASAVERMPLILQPHPDVWLMVPDPVKRLNPVARPMLRVGQLRALQRAAYFEPEGRRRIFILDGAETLREKDSDLLLKILEEPPLSATLILIAPTPDSLRQTIRSRCLQFHFAPVPANQIEDFLKDREGAIPATPAQRKLAAQLSCGSPGAALSMDLEESKRLRGSLLKLIEQGVAGEKYGEIFAATAQLAKQEKESFENILDMLYSLLTDLLESTQGSNNTLPRNPDLHREVQNLSQKVNLDWVARATQGLDNLESSLRRNVGRQLGLDALVASFTAR
jgi:DNA polymerase-3 subunit delta'